MTKASICACGATIILPDIIAQAIDDPGSILPRRENESMVRWSARAAQEALFDAGYSIVMLDPLGTAIDPYIEDNDHIDHDSGEAGDNCNRCVAEEAYRALGIHHPLMAEAGQ